MRKKSAFLRLGEIFVFSLKKVLGFSEKVFGFSEKVFGFSEKVFGYSEQVYGSSEKVYGYSEIEISDFMRETSALLGGENSLKKCLDSLKSFLFFF